MSRSPAVTQGGAAEWWSDLTALYLAHHLGAETFRLLKDVDGVYERDPIDPQGVPARFDELHYTDALRLEARVIQEKALRFAAAHGVSFQVAAPGREWATRIGPSSSRFPSAV